MKTKVMRFDELNVGDVFQWGDSYDGTRALLMKVDFWAETQLITGYVYLSSPFSGQPGRGYHDGGLYNQPVTVLDLDEESTVEP